ncbi:MULTISPECIES: MFS transporter [unclassified Bacillus (in: firmicutes)]|uniref:MFS transporter n=1 Tax=unclassified Bacillus (in: firmicutes) TaxID=185979 RepID=UPI0009E2E20F|nr:MULTISPECIES: MFS transporter [unclassified Bacillus (in: firmicutes)]
MLWSSSVISSFGNQITIIGLPLIALYVLKASVFEISLITTFTFLPNFLLGFQAGAYVDRLSNKKVMIVSQMLSAIFLTILSCLIIFEYLNLFSLYILAFLLGSCSVFFSLAYYSYMPMIVDKKNLQDGNSRLEITNGAIQIAGPGFGGLLIQMLTIPFAILFDVLSFIISLVLISLIPERKDIKTNSTIKQKKSIWIDVIEGIKFTFSHSLLRPLLISYFLSVIFIGLYQAISVIYMVNILGFTAATIGLILGIGNVGYILGALISKKVASIIGLGKSIIFSLGLYSVGFLIIGFAPEKTPFYFVIIGQLVISMGTPIYNVNAISLRQALTPKPLLARVSSMWRVLGRGFVPIGAFVGGGLANFMGLREVIFIAAIGGFLALLPSVFSKVTKVTTTDIDL